MNFLIFALFMVACCATISLAGPPKRRKNIETLTPEELLSYRELVQAALNDGSFTTVAGWHGMPLMSNPDQTGFCVHGTPAFLMWHRFYLTVMEMIIGCPIPYWDWRSPRIPRAFSEATYVARNGSTVTNPLYSAYLPPNVRTIENPSAQMSRMPDNPFPSVDLIEKEDFATFGTNDFKNFSAALEDCHNLAHVSLGGVLQYLDVAAFDPMFWSLHMNTERLFFQWQLIHDNYVYPPDVAQMPIELKSYTIRAADLLPYFDGWLTGTSKNEIQRWKTSLKAEVAKRSKATKFGVLEAASSPVMPSPDMSSLISTIAVPPSFGAQPSMVTPDVAASQLLASAAVSQPTLAPVALPVSNASSTSPSIAALRTRLGLPANTSSLQSPDEHVESPFALVDIGAAGSQDHIMLNIKQVPSTQKPAILMTVLNGRVVGKTGMFGMGSSPMTAFKMDRPVDLSRAYEKLGYRAMGLKPQELIGLLEFRMEDCRTGIQTPYTPPAIALDQQCF